MGAYLDNSATTKPCAECINKINEMLLERYGNASSLHNMGIDAAKELIAARAIIADSIGANKEEVYFTSGATEANNIAVFGAAYANKRKGNRIVITAIEHESVLQAAQELENQGFEVIKIKPDGCGKISEQQIFDAVNSNTILVSMMMVNNEVGSVLPVKIIKKAVDRSKAPALIHIDCVQAYGKMPIKVNTLGAALISITAHKIHGAKGIGALYVKKGTHILPRTFGGEQEKRLRPGTECTPLIAGFGAAVKALPDISAQNEKMTALCSYAKEKLSKIDGIMFNSPDDASPYIINIYIPTFMRSQTIIQELSSNYQIYVSSGSACSKGKKSHVLAAMGLKDEIIDKSIRVSFSRENTKKDVDCLVNALADLIKKYPRD